MNKVVLVLSVDRRFTQGCAATLASAARNLGAGWTIEAYVLHEGLSPRVASIIRSACGDRGSVRDITVPIRDLRGLRQSKNFSLLAYARLMIGDLLPRNVNRCIYLDTDIIVERDLTELWQADLQSMVLAGVPNGTAADDAGELGRLGMKAARYLNSGVLLIDLEAWRRLGVGRRAIEYCRVYKPDIMDQDGLNVVLGGAWLQLEAHWNLWTRRTRTWEGCILHFVMSPKPWDPDYTGPFAGRFFHYLDQTGFVGWRPWNWLGLGAAIRRTRRRMPYLPTVFRVAKSKVAAIARRPAIL